MGGIILLGVVALGVMRLLVGLDSLGQIYLTIFILLCAVAYQVVSRSTRDTSTVQKYDPGAIYESELTSLHQAAKEYSQEEVARFVKARFSQRDVETFQKNLTEAQENVLTWEFVVRQSGYLVLIETVTHGLDSAKKIIADIQQHPRKMLKFGDFLYTTLPNVTRLSTEFSDLTQNQAQARKAALVLIKKLSGDVTKMYEAAQLADVQEVVRESGATLAGDSMAESLASMKAEADATPSNDEFNIVQQALTEQGARGSATENSVGADADEHSADSAAADSPKTSSAAPSGAARPTIPVSRREIQQQQRTLDALVAALVGGSLGAVWTPGVLRSFVQSSRLVWGALRSSPGSERCACSRG
jgi:5-bromo-4-chloroindolyl phosphate hydrolysis protein